MITLWALLTADELPAVLAPGAELGMHNSEIYPSLDAIANFNLLLN